MAPANSLPIHGNNKTMNLNTLILANIQASTYFKIHLFECKTYHEVLDEIYNKVNHLEPWEKGSRKTAGQTGMCGGVRGVGAGGIVSSAYCLLYKLFTLKLTKKQLNGLINHKDSPYIRGLGFMYIRYTQPPTDFWEWFAPYLEDEEEVDVKAGGGHVMTIGEMVRKFIVSLDWNGTLFPRIPVPAQKQIMETLKAHDEEMRKSRGGGEWDGRAREDGDRRPPTRDMPGGRERDDGGAGRGGDRDGAPVHFGEAERMSKMRAAGSADRSPHGGHRSSPVDRHPRSEKDAERHRPKRSRSPRDDRHRSSRSRETSRHSPHGRDSKAARRSRSPRRNDNGASHHGGDRRRRSSKSPGERRHRSKSPVQRRHRSSKSPGERKHRSSKSPGERKHRSKSPGERRHRSKSPVEKRRRSSKSPGEKRRERSSRSPETKRHKERETSFERDLRKEQKRQNRDKERDDEK